MFILITSQYFFNNTTWDDIRPENIYNMYKYHFFLSQININIAY